MTKASIYSKSGRRLLEEEYESYIKDLPIQVEREMVETRYGKTHVLIGGPKDGAPIILLQGGNCINPMTLAWFLPLFDHYRIYAPDTIGHPGFSEENRISAKDESFAIWIEDIMGHFRLEESTFIGPSYGAGIILRLATYHPGRITNAVLVSPSGISLGSKKRMIRKILLPLLLYRFTKKERHLRKVTNNMSNNEMNESDVRIIGKIFQYTTLEQEMPKLTTSDELKDYHAPTLIVGGKQDLFFPSKIVLNRAKQIFNGPLCLREYEMAHFPSKQQVVQINHDIQLFLSEHATKK